MICHLEHTNVSIALEETEPGLYLGSRGDLMVSFQHPNLWVVSRKSLPRIHPRTGETFLEALDRLNTAATQ